MQLHRIKYVSSNGQEVDLDSLELSAGVAFGLKGDRWESSLENGKLKDLSRCGFETSLTLTFRDFGKANTALNVFDYDNAKGLPGKIVCDDWYQEANIVETELSEQYRDTYAVADCSVVLHNGFWRKNKIYKFSGWSESSTGLDYPHDYDFDYSHEKSNEGYIDVQSSSGAHIGIRFLGACESPEIEINDNIYGVQANAGEGEEIVVNPFGVFERGHSIYKLLPFGKRENLFEFQVEEKNNQIHDIFKKIERGFYKVRVSSETSVILTVYEESGLLPWT